MNSLAMDFITLLLTFLVILFSAYYFHKKASYFVEHGIPYIKPLPIIGNMAPPIFNLTSLAAYIQKLYNFNKDAKYIGCFDFQYPTILIRDPELVKDITIKYFDNFMDHSAIVDPIRDPLFGNNLFLLQGDKWRQVRSLLSPSFTSSKMRGMFELMTECSENFTNYWLENLQEGNVTVNSKEVFTKYTNDVIATCAFGIAIDSMRNPDNEFYVYGSKTTTTEGTLPLKFFLLRSFPIISKLLNIKLIDAKTEEFFYQIIRETIATRDKEGISRPDVIQLMMETRNNPGQGLDLSIEEMTSQAFVFFFAGFETLSILMCFVAHLIANNPDVQQKLMDEVDEVYEKCNGAPTYDMVKSMEYLDAVVNETLRLYSVSPILDRICTKDFELPPALPGLKPYCIKAGDTVWFPIFGFHRDSAYYPEPEKFSPERFLGNSKALLNSPTYIPFGIGPRLCLGNRFALMETKIVFFHLIAKCYLKPSNKMKLPLELANGIGLNAKGGFWIEMESRNKK